MKENRNIETEINSIAGLKKFKIRISTTKLWSSSMDYTKKLSVACYRIIVLFFLQFECCVCGIEI